MEDATSPVPWYSPLTRVTPLSKALAMALFVVLPFVGFWLGVELVEKRTISIAPCEGEQVPSQAGHGIPQKRDTVDEIVFAPRGIANNEGDVTFVGTVQSDPMCVTEIRARGCGMIVGGIQVSWGSEQDGNGTVEEGLLYGDLAEVHGRTLDALSVTTDGKREYYVRRYGEHVDASGALYTKSSSTDLVENENVAAGDHDPVEGKKCFTSAQYTVVEISRADDVGSDFYIWSNATPKDAQHRCNSSTSSADYSLTSLSATYGIGIVDSRMLLDSGTGPDPRGLSIYELGTRQEVYDDLYAKPTSLDETRGEFQYWRPLSGTPVTERNCPELPEYERMGFSGAVLEEYVILNVRTLQITSNEERRCEPLQ